MIILFPCVALLVRLLPVRVGFAFFFLSPTRFDSIRFDSGQLEVIPNSAIDYTHSTIRRIHSSLPLLPDVLSFNLFILERGSILRFGRGNFALFERPIPDRTIRRGEGIVATNDRIIQNTIWRAQVGREHTDDENGVTWLAIHAARDSEVEPVLSSPQLVGVRVNSRGKGTIDNRRLDYRPYPLTRTITLILIISPFLLQ